MWYKIDKDGFSRQDLLRLYNTVEMRITGFREDLFRFTNFYSAVCFAILGVTLSAFVNLYDKGNVNFILLFGPLTTICMCFLGLRVTNQIYRRIQQETSVKAKLENILGLDQQIPVMEFSAEKTIWSNDEALLPDRHAKRRFLEDSSAHFVDSGSLRKGGVNKNNKIYFGIIGFVAVLLCIAITLSVVFKF